MSTGQDDLTPTVIDLFCGAGGLSAGLEGAGWRTVAAVDFDADCIATLKAVQAARIPVLGNRRRSYLAETRLVEADLASVRAQDLRPPKATARWRPDLLAGGPPCQPFSSAGHQRGVDDPRGKMFLEFARLAAELRPRFILFENVAGLVTAKTPDGRPGGVLRLVQRSFEEIGYACRFDLLNAADFGAPQRRVRLFMIASIGEPLPNFPSPTHSRTTSDLFERRQPWVRLRDFLATQPAPDPVDVVRPSDGRARELAMLRPGSGLKSKGIVEANRPSGHWGYKQDCFLADQMVPARTIRAATTPDWIRLRDGSLRRLTWRECAGLQGFTESWPFSGNTASKFRQIGNAVQGHVAHALGRALLMVGLKRRAGKPDSAPWPPYFHRRVRYTEMEHHVNGGHRAAARQPRTG